MIAYIVGNGTSRQSLDLSSIQYPVLGSNAVHRDYPVDYLVCCDRRMVEEALNSGYPGKIFTRRDWYHRYPKNCVFPLPEFDWREKLKWQQSFHWGSGLHSVHLAIKLGYTELRLWGFDLWARDGRTNNIYAGTENYSSADDSGVDPSFWIRQFAWLFERYPDVVWLFHNTKTWKIPPEWKNYPNFRLTRL